MQVQAIILVSGMVQGVGYRFFVSRQAHKYGLTGWVRNLPDGNVEILAEGVRGLIEELAQDLYTGNPYAHVSGVRVNYQTYTGKYKSFEIKG
jgi:acylphosphatase